MILNDIFLCKLYVINTEKIYIYINKYIYIYTYNIDIYIYITFSPGPMVSFRSARKLSSYLVRAKLYPLERKVGSSKCGKRRCEVCNNVTDASTFSSTVTGDTFKINYSLNCDGKCFIYLTTCTSVINNTRVKLQICFVIDENFDRKESCMQEHLYKYFQTEGHKGFLNEASVTFIDKTDGKVPKKEKDIGCEH